MRAAASFAVLAALAAAPPAPAGPAMDYLRDHLPAMRAVDRARAAARPPAPREAAPRYQVGDSRQYWAWDLSVMPPGFRQVTATCRAVGPHSYLFVEDSLAEAGKVSPQDVARLVSALDQGTPGYSVDPGRGIMDLEREWLGEPPDALDGDPRVHFLVLRMDTFNGMGFDGYFNAFDQLPEAVAWEQYQQHSNEVEMLYLNGGRGDIAGAYMRGVLAHELAHLLAFRYDGEEQGWLSEALGEAAMQLTGYFTDQGHVNRYATRPGSPLVRETYADYGACYLFAAWLRGLEGPAVWGELLRDPGRGTASVEGVLAARGREVAFADLHAAWAADNLRKGRNERVRAYRHPGVILPPMATLGALDEGQPEASGQLRPWAVAYTRAPAGPVALQVEGPVRVYEVLRGQAPRLVHAPGDAAEFVLEDLNEARDLVIVGAGEGDEAFSLRLR